MFSIGCCSPGDTQSAQPRQEGEGTGPTHNQGKVLQGARWSHSGRSRTDSKDRENEEDEAKILWGRDKGETMKDIVGERQGGDDERRKDLAAVEDEIVGAGLRCQALLGSPHHQAYALPLPSTPMQARA